MDFSRRSFLKGAALSALGVAAAGVLPNTEAKAEEVKAEAVCEHNAWLGQAPVIADSEIAATYTTDLLIIGAGNGGLMAASVASDYGIDFRVIEQNAVVGSTRYWYGAINTEETKKAGVEVNTAALRSEISRYSSGKMDQRVLNVWINESAAMHDYVAPILSAAGATCQFTAAGEKEVENYTQYYYPATEHFWGMGVKRNELFQQRIEE